LFDPWIVMDQQVACRFSQGLLAFPIDHATELTFGRP
jgi:hypothetical protein